MRSCCRAHSPEPEPEHSPNLPTALPSLPPCLFVTPALQDSQPGSNCCWRPLDRCICDVQSCVDPQCCPRPLAWPYLAPLLHTAPAVGASRCERGKGDRGERIRPVKVTNRLHIPQKSTGSSPLDHLGDDHIWHFAGLVTLFTISLRNHTFYPMTDCSRLPLTHSAHRLLAHFLLLT